MNPQKPQHLVILIHGIRTEAFWAEMVAAVLESDCSLKVMPLRYGFFDLFRFLSPVFTRKAPVRRIIQELQDLRADYPEAKISVIAHSFGTYGIVEALKSDPNIRLHRMILCGSVVYQDFRRANFRAQLDPNEDILNDCGSDDVWPVLAQSVTWGYSATGTFGFGTTGVEDRFNNFRHGDYFNKDYVRDFWLPYISGGEIRQTHWQVERGPTPYWMSLLGWMPLRWAIAMLGTAGLLFVLWLAFLKQPATPPANIVLGEVVTIGHNTGFPSVQVTLTFDNPTRESANFSNFLSLRLISPEGKDYVLQIEGMVVAGLLRQPIPAISANPGDKASFDASYFTYEPSFVSLQRDILALAGTIRADTMPDPRRELVAQPLAERAAQIARDNFIWSAGRWKLELAYLLDGRSLNVARYLDLSQKEVDEMKAIIDIYPSGIGLFPNWRFLFSGSAKPVIQKVLLNQ